MSFLRAPISPAVFIVRWCVFFFSSRRRHTRCSRDWSSDVCSSDLILLLATNPRGAEHLKDLLIGQILWVNPAELPLVALVSAVILALWFGFGERAGRIGFYLLFA